MHSTLRSPAVAETLERLFDQAKQQDQLAKQRVRDSEAEVGSRLDQARRYELYGDAPLAITPEVGQLLYVLALSRPAGRIVEFGSSHGISTIHLAAAIRDMGAGLLITTEHHPDKIAISRRNLAEAGLGDLVELRPGDALDTLKDVPTSVDFLFLDGRNDLYLSVLGLVEPHLATGALVLADLNVDDPDLLPYLEHVRDPDNGYASICVPLDAGVEVSVRMRSIG